MVKYRIKFTFMDVCAIISQRLTAFQARNLLSKKVHLLFHSPYQLD